MHITTLLSSSSLPPGYCGTTSDKDDRYGRDLPASPFPHLIDTYSTPVDSEVESINTHIHNLETEIGEIERKIALLQKQRSQLTLEALMHKGMVSPLRRLPAELLIKTFKLAIHNWPRRLRSTPVSNEPWIFAAVCRRWRSIVLSAPTLWSSLRTTLSRRLPPDRLATLLQTYLDHSADVPLDIDFHNNEVPVTRMVSENAYRIRRLKLPLTSLTELAHRPFSRLEDLQLYHSIHGYGHDTVIWPEQGLCHDTCRNLKRLAMDQDTWSTLSASPPAVQLALPWDRLTSLSLQALPHPNGLVPVLQKASRTLLSLDITLGWLVDLKGLWSGHHIHMQTLQTLICDVQHTALCLLLNCLITPSLRTLHTRMENEADAAAINNMIARSSYPPISSLTFTDAPNDAYGVSLKSAFSVLRNPAVRKSLQELAMVWRNVLFNHGADAMEFYHTMMDDPVLSQEPPFLSLKTLVLHGLLDRNSRVSLGTATVERLLSDESQDGVKLRKLMYSHGLQVRNFPDEDNLQAFLGAFRSRGVEVEVRSMESYECSAFPGRMWWS